MPLRRAAPPPPPPSSSRPQFLGILRVTLFAEMWSRFVWGRGGGGGREWAHLPERLGLGKRASGLEPVQDSKACPDVMVGGHEDISDPQGALSIQHAATNREQQHR